MKKIPARIFAGLSTIFLVSAVVFLAEVVGTAQAAEPINRPLLLNPLPSVGSQGGIGGGGTSGGSGGATTSDPRLVSIIAATVPSLLTAAEKTSVVADIDRFLAYPATFKNLIQDHGILDSLIANGSAMNNVLNNAVIFDALKSDTAAYAYVSEKAGTASYSKIKRQVFSTPGGYHYWTPPTNILSASIVIVGAGASGYHQAGNFYSGYGGGGGRAIVKKFSAAAVQQMAAGTPIPIYVGEGGSLNRTSQFSANDSGKLYYVQAQGGIPGYLGGFGRTLGGTSTTVTDENITGALTQLIDMDLAGTSGGSGGEWGGGGAGTSRFCLNPYDLSVPFAGGFGCGGVGSNYSGNPATALGKNGVVILYWVEGP